MACLPWFKLPTALPSDPRVRALERAVGPAALAYLVRLRAWLASYAPSGRYSGPEPVHALERGCEWGGEEGALVEALVHAGLLAREGEALVDLEWAEEQAVHAERAASEAARKRAARAAKKAAADSAARANVPAASAGRPADVLPQSHGRPTAVPPEKEIEKERETEKKQPPHAREGEQAQSLGQQDLLPHEPPPSTEPALGDLLDADFQALRGAEYRRDRSDPAAMGELLARGAPAEIRRRWRIGIAVTGYGRCSKWADLVRFWNDHATAPPERSGARPGKPPARSLNRDDYREGPVEAL
ncbi:hypothetical protein [Corallococcus sp. AS-1-6]|uniref:hypothetical protein n=1 Tax=Corallococcus sp. AS-1-6 TaxID=2874599 RepID=UPI001CBF05E6|nr:hypothetical protein [Corallococcus sp. AS-1-6]MBZ4371453.1 hypothetical protein [Corallococcus sp. AS-1-6]